MMLGLPVPTVDDMEWIQLQEEIKFKARLQESLSDHLGIDEDTGPASQDTQKA